MGDTPCEALIAGYPPRAGGGQGDPGCWGFSGESFGELVSPRCGEGAREAPALARDPLWVQRWQEELVPGPQPQLSV